MWQYLNDLYNDNNGREISIFEHVLAHINPEGPGLLSGGEVLLDDADYEGDEFTGWAPGAWDSALAFPVLMSPEEKAEQIEKIETCFRELSSKPTAEAVLNLERELSVCDTLTYIDQVLQWLIISDDVNQPVVYQTARYLFLRSRKRGAVKFALSIMGLFGIPDDVELFMVIGRHGEFTLYAATAIISSCRNPVDFWLEMAKNVDGWGRVHLINRLVDYPNSEVKKFLLREGCRTGISSFITAATIAESIDLAGILSTTKVRGKSLEGAGIILQGLIEACKSEKVFKGLDSYEGGFTAVKHYLKTISKRKCGSFEFLIIEDLKKLIDVNEAEDYLKPLNWSREEKNEMLALIQELLEDREGSFSTENLVKRIKKEIDSGSSKQMFNALEASLRIEFRPFDILLKRLKKEPLSPDLWQAALSVCDKEGIEELAAIAIKDIIPVVSSPRKSENSLLIVPVGSKEVICFEKVLRELYRFPGQGLFMIIKALEHKDERVNLHGCYALYPWESYQIGEIKSELTSLLKRYRMENKEMTALHLGHIMSRAGLAI